jgi:glyoxylase-like metal-dependent hydrolase (beta-lactamase superfamily II)
MFMKPNVHTIDLQFKGVPTTIGVYLIPYRGGGILIECGPGSTIPALTEGIKSHGLTPQEITDVFLTHIHLDHAGSAGWWARQGATIHVHEVGAPHMRNPEKLLKSAGRIYGDQMEPLWGEFLPVPEEKLHSLTDGDRVTIDEVTITAFDTPGHATHHLSYLWNGVCFTGDVGGVRLPGIPALRIPSVPPEFHIESWRATIQQLRKEDIQWIAPTHFGLHSDVEWHFDTIESSLDAMETWLDDLMATTPSQEEFRKQFVEWMHTQALKSGIPEEMIAAYDLAIASEMSADGAYRYWNKFRSAS